MIVSVLLVAARECRRGPWSASTTTPSPPDAGVTGHTMTKFARYNIQAASKWAYTIEITIYVLLSLLLIRILEIVLNTFG